MKIVSKKRIGNKNVYDIGVAQDHNFLIEGSLVASNCFNRSHSLAYSRLAGQCAYLKVRYPLQFMAALLTINAGKSDKLTQYLNVAKSSKLKVLPPDINRSESGFTTTKKGAILFGLRGLDGLGEAAIAPILTARQNAPFTSLADFCERVNINNSCVESLIKTGAFDAMIFNRATAIAHLPKLQQWASNKRKSDNAPADQLSLFATDSFVAPPPDAVQREEYSQIERLNHEKEILGVYLSGHPLDSLPSGARLSSLKVGQKATVSVHIVACYPKESRNGPYANLEIEDKWGNGMKAVCWADEYLKFSYALEKDSFVQLEGKVTEWNERLQLSIGKVLV